MSQNSVSNMNGPTFETERIQELRNERIQLQKKTFTKWVNAFLDKGGSLVEDLFDDLSDGKKLIRLLEIISGEKVGAIARGKHRIHKLENVSKALQFLQKSVKLESIGPEDVVDGKEDLILGLIWMIILRFQISDVQKEQESKDAKSAKEALLLWCQRKTKGYKGVDVKNFTSSWKNGLAFNALIHSHRPDLFDYSRLQPSKHTTNLQHAFDVAHQKLGIAKLLDPEDVDCAMPDEKSVMTYVAMLYQHFAKMKSEETGGRRIAKILGNVMEIEMMKEQYIAMLTELLTWISKKTTELQRALPNRFAELQEESTAFKSFRIKEKPPKYTERMDIEAHFFCIQTKIIANKHKPYHPPEGTTMADINCAWNKMQEAENKREVRLREELVRHEKLARFADNFHSKAELRESWLEEIFSVLASESQSEETVLAVFNRHKTIEADVRARVTKFDALRKLCAELEKEKYEDIALIKKRQHDIESRWKSLLSRLDERSEELKILQGASSIREGVEALSKELKMFESVLGLENYGQHLPESEDLLQRHLVIEAEVKGFGTKLPAIDKKIDLTDLGIEEPEVLQECEALKTLYKNVNLLASQRSQRLQAAIERHHFLDSVREELTFVKEKQQLAASKEVGKDLIGLTRLQKKHQALAAEVDACSRRCESLKTRGKDLECVEQKADQEVKSLLRDLGENLEILKESIDLRSERLSEAAQSFQYYSDANDAESWLHQQISIASNEDFGRDIESTETLLQAHEKVLDEIKLFAEDLMTLQRQCQEIEKVDGWSRNDGTKTGSSETECGDAASDPVLSDTDEESISEEPQFIEKEVEREVVKEIKVNQAVALYPYKGQGLSLEKGENVFVITKTNDDWWTVRRASNKEIGYAPAKYLKETAPRIVRKVTKEKVKVQERVSPTEAPRSLRKTSKSERKGSVQRNSSMSRKIRGKLPRRKRRFTAHFDRENVTNRQLAIAVMYDKLKKLGEERKRRLSDSLAYFRFCDEKEDALQWILDKDSYVRKSFNSNDLQALQNLVKKVSTDILAYQDSVTSVLNTSQTLLESETAYRESIATARKEVMERWETLRTLLDRKTSELREKYGVEIFSGKCKEAEQWLQEKLGIVSTPQQLEDLETIRALQRRHLNFEREMSAFEESVAVLDSDCKRLCQDQPASSTEVTRSLQSLRDLLEKVKGQAAAKRKELENAYGLRGFMADYREIMQWSAETQSFLQPRVQPTNLVFVREQISELEEKHDEAQVYLQRAEDLVKYGRKLQATNPSSSIEECIEEANRLTSAVPVNLENRKQLLERSREFLTYLASANADLNTCKAQETIIQSIEEGNTTEVVESQLKKLSDVLQKILQLESKFMSMSDAVQHLKESEDGYRDRILDVENRVKEAVSAIKRVIQEKESSLLLRMDFIVLQSEAEELLSWIADKLLLAKDQSFLDNAYVQRSILKQEALQAEVAANEKGKEDIIAAGETMINDRHPDSPRVNDMLNKIQGAWNELKSQCHAKSNQLNAATKARQFMNKLSEFDIWADQATQVLLQGITGNDLSLAKFRRRRLSKLAEELESHQNLVDELCSIANELTVLNYEKAKTLEPMLEGAKTRLHELRRLQSEKEQLAGQHLVRIDLLHDITDQINWVQERLDSMEAAALGDNILETQRLIKRQEGIEVEVKFRKSQILGVIKRGQDFLSCAKSPDQELYASIERLELSTQSLEQASKQRKDDLNGHLKLLQCLANIEEAYAWLKEKMKVVEKQTFGHDLASAEAVVIRCRSLESGIDLYKGNVLTVAKEIDETMTEKRRQRVQLEKKKVALLKDFEKLQKFCQHRCKVLSDSLQFYQFFSDAENVQKWIVEKFKQVSVDSLGSDWEDNQVLEAQLSEFKMSLAAGVQDYESCLSFAKGMVESKHSQSKKIEDTSQKLSSSFEKLQAKIKQREDKLLRAGKLHKFNMMVADALSRIKEKHAAMSMAEIRPDLPGAERMVRRHKGICLDLNTIQQRLQEIQTDMNKLQPKFVGQTLQQLTQYGNYVMKAFSDLLIKSRKIELLLIKNVEYLRFDKELQSLLSWSEETHRSVSTEVVIQSVSDAEMALSKLEDLKIEVDGKEDKFTKVCTFGENLIQDGHAKKDKVQDNLERLLSSREKLHQAWVYYSELYVREHDFQILCREARKLESTIAFQMSFLVIPEDLKAVEEYEKIMSKYETYQKIQETVVSRCNALASFAEEFDAAESDHAGEVSNVVLNIQKKLESYSCKLKESKANIEKLKEISKLRSSTTELLSWISDKFSLLDFKDGDQSLSLATDIQRHKVFRAEVTSHEPLFQSCLNTASDLRDCEYFEKYELPPLMDSLEVQWKALGEANRERSLTLDEEKAKSEFRRDVEFAVLILQDKLSLLATLQLGSSRENAWVVKRRLLVVEKETTADVARMEELKKTSQSLIQKFPTSSVTVQSLEETVREKWGELQALMAAKKSELCRDQEVFDALLQLDEALEKVSKKGNLLEDCDLPTDLQALKNAIKKHHNFEMDSNALQEMVETTLNLARETSTKHAFRREDIQAKAGILADEWSKANALSSTRKNALTAAWNMSSFDINVTSLLKWMTKMIDKLNEPVTPRTVKEAKLMLKKHEDILSEFKVKDNVLNQVTETGHKLVLEKRLEDRDVTPHLEKLRAQREELDKEWERKNRHLMQCLYFQKFNRDAGQIEAWLSRHAQDLSDTDPGNSLEETTLVMSKLGNLEASLEKHYQSLQDLKDFAANRFEVELFQAPEITRKIDELWKDLEKVFLDKEEKKRSLEKALNYYQIINLVNDMIDWIKSRLRYAGENFVSLEDEFSEKRQLFQLFEIEVTSNEQKYKDLCAEAERTLLTVPHNIVLRETLENLSKAWQELKEISVNTREGIVGRKNIHDFEAELEKLSSWLVETERSLKSDEHGKDLKMATFLLRQHDVLSSKFLTKSEKMLELENKMAAVETGEATRTKFLDMKKRFEDTSVAMGKKSQALQEAIALHQYIKLLKGEENWIRAKEPLVNEKDIGSDLTTCENLIQNYRVTENDIESHFVVFEETLMGIDQGKITDENKKESLSSFLETVTARWQALVQQTALRKKRLEFAESVFKFVSEINNCSAWLQERAPLIHTKDCGNDEESAQYLLHNHEALIAELQSFAEKVEALGSWSCDLLKSDSIDFIDIAKKQANFEDQYRELLTAAEGRLVSLKEAVQMFHYLEEADALELWINTKMSEVYNEDCGVDLDQAEQLMREFEDFARELVNNEDRLAVFNGLAQVMLDADHTQSEMIELRSEEICNLWMQLRYAAQLRLRSLEDARNTFAFSNEIAETTNWIKTKREDLITCDVLKDRTSVEELSRKHEIFMGDLPALKEKVQGINKHAEYFRSEFPSMADNVDERVNEMENLYGSLAAETQRTSESLAQAWRLKQFFEDVFNIRSWMEEFSASLQNEVDALSSKTRSAEDSRARYLEYRAEAESRSGVIVSLGKQANDLMSFTPLISTCVEQEISQLEEHRNLLLDQLNRFSNLLNQSKNSESLETDLSHINSWLTTKEDLLDFTVGESLEDVLEQLKSQDDFESSLAVQEELLNAVLKRCDSFTDRLRKKTDSSLGGVNVAEQSGEEIDASQLKFRKRTGSNPPLPSFLSIDENMASSKPDLAQTLSSPESGPLSRHSSLGALNDNPALTSWEARVKTPDLVLYKPMDGSALSSSELASFVGKNVPQILITDENSVTLTYEEISSHHRISRKSLRDFDSIDFAGVLERKVVSNPCGLRGARRSWKCCYVVLSGEHVYFYRNEKKFRKGELIEEPALISGAHCELEASTGKRENVVRLRLVDGYEMRLSTDFEEVFEDFLIALSEAIGEIGGEHPNTLSLELLPINGELIETPPPKGFDYDDFLRAAEYQPSMSYLSPSTEFCRSDSVDLDDDDNEAAFEISNDDSDLEIVEGSIFDDDTFEDDLDGSVQPSELDIEVTRLPDKCNTTQLLSLDDVMPDGDFIDDFDFEDLTDMHEFELPLPDMEDEGFQDSERPRWNPEQSQDMEDETVAGFARIGDASPSPLSQSCSSDDLENSLTGKRKKKVTFNLEPKDVAVTLTEA